MPVYKKNYRNYKKIYRGEKPLNNYIDNTIKQLFNQKGFHFFKLVLEWKNIVTKEMAENSMPRKEINNGSNKILEIEIYDPALSIEFQYGKGQIIDDINNFFGGCYIEDIKYKMISKKQEQIIKKENKTKLVITQGKIALKEQIRAISNDKLKKSLMNLIN